MCVGNMLQTIFCYSMNLKSIILNLCRCCKRDRIYVLGNKDNNLFSLFDIDTLTTYIVFPTVLESVVILSLGDSG